jgi:DNA recombination protein Rad52
VVSQTKDAPPGASLPTPEEAEQQAADPQPEPEVRPDELTRGTEKGTWQGLPEQVVDELAKPLDPNRVRRRAGRGGGQFEYLAGHDVKRRANELFGFGNWGYEVVEQVEDEAVEVANDKGKEGWHICYRTVVRVSVRDCIPFSDVGYGDGVEYGPAAKATARELAMKESVTDALKRALTGWGDQFGLILYAKGDEKQRINRERNVGDTTTYVRRDHDPGVPRTWTEINAWAEPYGGELGWSHWVSQAAAALYGDTSWSDLTTAQKTALGRKASGAIVALREAHDSSEFPPPERATVQAAWAKVMDGTVLDGPEWRMSPSESERPPFNPPRAEPTAEEQAAAESVEFGKADTSAQTEAAQEK